jgi:hypothetical protein
MTNQFRHVVTKQADGVYVTWHREECDDPRFDPRDYLFQDEEYREEDQARLDAWKNDEWHGIGIRARADILIVRNGVGTTHTLTSAGLWGIESDSGEEYLSEVFEEEKAALREDIKALGSLPIQEDWPTPYDRSCQCWLSPLAYPYAIPLGYLEARQPCLTPTSPDAITRRLPSFSGIP